MDTTDKSVNSVWVHSNVSSSSFILVSKDSKKESVRCNKCNKKLGLIPFKCRCENNFCAAHRVPEEHSCRFDYVENHRQVLLKTMSTPILGKKVSII